jgi:hypothetical protein
MEAEMFLRILAATTFLLLFGSCGCESEHPVSEEESTQADDRLLTGYWYYSEDDDGREGVAQFEEIPGKAGHYRLVAFDDRGQLSVIEDQWEFVTTRIGKRHYFSVRRFDADGMPGNWTICEYRFTDPDRLEVHTIDAKSACAAIEADRIAGKMLDSDGFFGPQPHLTASTAELRDFLASQNGAVFEQEPTWVYVRHPEPPEPRPPVPPKEIERGQGFVTVAIIVAIVVIAVLAD